MKKTDKNTKFHDETLELFIKTMTKIMRKIVKEELKKFEEYYTDEVLTPALASLRSDLEDKISSSTNVT